MRRARAAVARNLNGAVSPSTPRSTAPSTRTPRGSTTPPCAILDELTAQHGDNPETWGQKAKLLYAHGKVEEAEEALEKAFALNRNYPYGLLLRAAFRYQEGEVPGALLLARRAADAYDPEARDYIAEAYSIVYECEMKLNRPVAAQPRYCASCCAVSQPRRRCARPSIRCSGKSRGCRPRPGASTR